MWGSMLVIIGSVLIVTTVSVFATSIYLHRALAHRSLVVHPVADHVFRFIIWVMVGVSRREWVAVHRKHHTFTDVPGDPHSPRLVGLWRVQLGNFVYYLREARKPEVLETWAADLPPDRWDRMIYTRHWLGAIVGIGSLMVLIGWWQGLVASMIHGVLLTLVLAPIVNGLCHWHGQQNFENTAHNIGWLTWVTAGESLHNNHHGRPRSSKFSVGPGEFDPAWPVIQGLERIGMVTSVRRD